MSGNKSPRYYLVAAIIWTLVALFALVMLFLSNATIFPKLCGIVLVGFCVASQWLRYRKMK